MEFVAAFWWLWILMGIAGMLVMVVGGILSFAADSFVGVVLNIVLGWGLIVIGYGLFMLSMILNLIDFIKA